MQASTRLPPGWPGRGVQAACGVAEGDEKTEVRSVIDAGILGHIFEQSITDLERLRPCQEGAVYTPAFITRYILSAKHWAAC